MRNSKQFKITVLFVLIFLTCSMYLYAAAVDYKKDISAVSQYILETANDLKQETDKPVLDSAEIKFLLDDMKELLRDYENMLVFAECPYPGEILLGRTPHGNDTWHETECATRYEGPFKEIRIRQTGGDSRYLRINDIELTYLTPSGPEKQTLNQGARTRFYPNEVFKLVLPKPMRISKIRILAEHDSDGLIISGVPYNFEPPRPGRERMERSRRPTEVLLGTTPPGNDGWLETICDAAARPVREIQLKRTGQMTDYLRINDIEITYQTPAGARKEVFNKGARARLYSDGVFKLVLPQPMRVTRIRILIEHRSAGLQVYGIY
ncbi:MAG: hypothetical protein JW787_03995 [Sedimentisphaerales bacterium]|nr:hypothetical protein [Sedimentisphaerales bacterium]